MARGDGRSGDGRVEPGQIRSALAIASSPEYHAILDTISDETLKVLFETDVAAIQRLTNSIQDVDRLFQTMSKQPDCFDADDTANTARMRRVLANELEWRKQRLGIALKEYDEKIVKLLYVMKERKGILDAHRSLHEDPLVAPLHEYFASKDGKLEEMSDKLKDRMRMLLHRPGEVQPIFRHGEGKEERDWRLRVRAILNPHAEEPEAPAPRTDDRNFLNMMHDDVHAPRLARRVVRRGSDSDSSGSSRPRGRSLSSDSDSSGSGYSSD